MVLCDIWYPKSNEKTMGFLKVFKILALPLFISNACLMALRRHARETRRKKLCRSPWKTKNRQKQRMWMNEKLKVYFDDDSGITTRWLAWGFSIKGYLKQGVGDKKQPLTALAGCGWRFCNSIWGLYVWSFRSRWFYDWNTPTTVVKLWLTTINLFSTTYV